MVHSYEIHGVPLKTGDIICTKDGKPDILPGEFWRFVGRLLPGDVDHIIIYVGPEGRCVEAGGFGVINIFIEDGNWDAERLLHERCLLVDTFYGVAYPLADKGLSPEEEIRIREGVATYCLEQIGKPYNINFLDPETEDAFYCSQLAYKAYQRYGINLNTGVGIPALPGTDVVVYPQEVWDGCVHQKYEFSPPASANS